MGRILVLALVVLATVPAVEIVEDVAGIEHRCGCGSPDEPSSSEGCCAALLHTCPCHHTSLVAPTSAVVITQCAARPPVLAVTDHLGLDAEAPPVRPPIA